MNLQRIIGAVKTEFGNVSHLSIHTYPDGLQGIAVMSGRSLTAVVVSTCPRALWLAVRSYVRSALSAKAAQDKFMTFRCDVCKQKCPVIYTLGGVDYCDSCARETEYSELYEDWKPKGDVDARERV
jgi:hypothetical protein